MTKEAGPSTAPMWMEHRKCEWYLCLDLGYCKICMTFQSHHKAHFSHTHETVWTSVVALRSLLTVLHPEQGI